MARDRRGAAVPECGLQAGRRSVRAAGPGEGQRRGRGPGRPREATAGRLAAPRGAGEGAGPFSGGGWPENKEPGVGAAPAAPPRPGKPSEALPCSSPVGGTHCSFVPRNGETGRRLLLPCCGPGLPPARGGPGPAPRPSCPRRVGRAEPPVAGCGVGAWRARSPWVTRDGRTRGARGWRALECRCWETFVLCRSGCSRTSVKTILGILKRRGFCRWLNGQIRCLCFESVLF